MKERDYDLNDGRIKILTNDFCEVINNIIKSIKQRQPRAGRSIFLLDQCGWKDVHLRRVIRKIFSELLAVEIILTIASEGIFNFLTTESIEKIAIQTGLSKDILSRIEKDDEINKKTIFQRVLRKKIREQTGARFDAPFFIRPARPRRALWFVHLSNHPTARNVMIGCHWDNKNTFEHFGHGGFGMLGFDDFIESKK